MTWVLVPDSLIDAINAKLDSAFEKVPGAEKDREVFFQQLLNYVDQHGFLPDFELQKNEPKRIQRRRTKGWRMPPNAVLIARPSKWGNPFRVGKHGNAQQCKDLYRRYFDGEISAEDTEWRNGLYDDPDLWGSPYLGKVLVWRGALEDLRDKDLCCWCPLDQPCHGDVLLELANPRGGD